MRLHAMSLVILGWLAGAAAAEPVDFNRDIRPILSKQCFACHGPDNEQRARGLRLDQREAAIKILKSGKTAIAPGKAEHSELVRRIRATDEERMPPADSGHHLTPTHIETLTRWIQEGAPYAEHWAFVKPGQAPLPPVKHDSWPRNALDYFVLARLEKEGLQPSPEADRYALLRRVSLDLRGLPPSLKEIEEFISDTSPNAYEKAVDRLLEDPAYGERWARMWLDLARYADSAGYGSDPLRTIWRYRDWVIDAFNRNLPYDQFTLEQMAGDLLPNPTLEQRMATAFHRNTMTNTEGGTDDEEFRVAAVKDRVDTTLQVWMGLTMGCAKCHHHKYDPITQQDYYRFFAFFNQTQDADKPDEQPTIPAPTPTILEQNRRIDGQVAELKKRLDVATPELAQAQAKWETDLRGTSSWAVLQPMSLHSSGGATFRRMPDGSVLVEGTSPANDTYTITAVTDLSALSAFRLEAIPDPSLPKGGSGRAADGSFVLSRFSVSAAPASQSDRRVQGRFVRVEIPGDAKILSLAEIQVFSEGQNIARKGTAEQSSTAFDGPARLANDGNTDGHYFDAKSTTHTATEANPWWEVKLPETLPIEQVVLWNRTDGTVGSRLSNFHISILDGMRKVVWQQDVVEPPRPKLELSPSGHQAIALQQAVADFSQDSFAIANVLKPSDGAKTGWAVAPRQTSPHTAVFSATTAHALQGSTLLTIRLEHKFKSPHHTLGRFRISVTDDPRALERARVPANILALVDTPLERRGKEQLESIASHYRSIAPALQSTRDEIARLEKSRPQAPTLPVMVELPAGQRRETKLLIKGNFLVPGEKVEAGVPATFHPLPTGAALDRVGVAKWLIAPENPLTSRVAVNRFWGQLFGKGLVETEEDFGTQGELPTHPQLLDWLAVEYKRLGWDTRALLRLLVTSATYRQTSRVSADLLEKDPQNRLMSRGPRFRLEAEMVRDQALAISGLLSRKIGGPSVYPPQPPGMWQAAFNGQRTWATSTGEDRYRRGLYTFWRRTVPYPSLATFDAPSRELCSIRRIRSNTPLQAFVTMNDPVYVECAQALARRIVREGGSTVDERIRFGLRLCLCRPPGEAHVRQLVELFKTELGHYRTQAKDAEALATDPLGPLPAGMAADELAAWTVLANVLLNLDAVLAKG